MQNDILLKALDERYKSIHIIRERIQTVVLWILGLLITGSAWVYQSDVYFDLLGMLSLFLVIICIWISIWKFYFYDLEKGFNSQRKIAAKIEEALGFYKKKHFSESEESMYPIEWKNSGKKNCEGKFMRNTYYLIALGFILSMLAIFSHTCI
ncbi:hypothetical protein KKH43_04795 [Patescibacteria group bacterium]|nr:hypothetical protein [Patescibacteria group bacterium]